MFGLWEGNVIELYDIRGCRLILFVFFVILNYVINLGKEIMMMLFCDWIFICWIDVFVVEMLCWIVVLLLVVIE